jgi:HK97 family phage portal protein
MSLFRFRRGGVQDEQRSWSLSQFSPPLGGYTVADSGRVVTIDRALRDDAVWACVDLIASSVASLPVDAVRVVGDERLPVSPVPSLLVSPSAQVPLDVWLYQIAFSMATDGNAWGLVTVTNERGFPTSIELVNPGAVVNRRLVDGVPTADVDGVEMQRWPNGDLWHAPGKVVPAGSWFAVSPVEYGANEIDAALAIQRYGQRFFTEGGHPSAIVYTDQQIDAEDAGKIKQAWLKATSGSREPAVFGSGWKYEPIQSSPESAQLIEAKRMAAVQVARRWLVPPAMIYAAMSGESITYQNVSQSDLQYLKHSLDRYLVRIEKALGDVMPDSQLVRFNRDALLRADTTTRYAAHQAALTNGWRTVNEVRALEDEAPFDDPRYDEPGLHSNASDPSDDDGGAQVRRVAELIQKIYLGVGKVLTADEAREIVNRAGAGLEGAFVPPDDTPDMVAPVGDVDPTGGAVDM